MMDSKSDATFLLASESPAFTRSARSPVLQGEEDVKWTGDWTMWAQAVLDHPADDAGWSRLPKSARRWCQRLTDPSTGQTMALSDWVAVRGTARAWMEGWAETHVGSTSIQEAAEDVLMAIKAVTEHPAGAFESCDGLIDLLEVLHQASPREIDNAWDVINHGGSAKSLSRENVHETVAQRLRLACIHRWLDTQWVSEDATSDERAIAPTKVWSWVQNWLNDGRVTLSALLNQRYVNGNAGVFGQMGAYSGWLLAGRSGSLETLMMWSRWEREGSACAEEASQRQWESVLAVLARASVQFATLDPVEQRQRVKVLERWIAWGEAWLRAGDPMPNHLTVNLGQWGTESFEVWRRRAPRTPTSWLFDAGRRWERVMLEQAMPSINENSPVVRARL